MSLNTEGFINSTVLVFVLFNPFLMSIYMMDLIQGLQREVFAKILLRASLISMMVFSLFAVGGEAVFSTVLQVKFDAFLVFGGVIFLVIGVRYVMQGGSAIRQMRGDPAHVEGSVAMPFMIGPGSISASVWSGTRLGAGWGIVSIALGLSVALVCLMVFKLLYDRIREHDTRLVERYVDISGRVSALWIGTFAVQMILTGVKNWLA